MADPTPTPDPTPDPTSTPDPTPTPDPKPDPTPTPDPDPAKGGKDQVLADLAKERDKRQELEQRLSEMETTQQTQLDTLAKALGLKPDDTPPDPAALTAEIETEKARAREAQVQLAVFKAAPGAQANAAALLDSASFLRSLADVDPTDGAAVTAAITAAVEANPLLGAAPAAGTTPSFGGGPRKTAPATAGNLSDAIAARYATKPTN